MTFNHFAFYPFLAAVILVNYLLPVRARWAWLPWPGRHQVELVNASGEVLDSIRLEVRGAGVKQSRR